MRGDLERRLLAVEAQRQGTPRAAEIVRQIETMSAQEFRDRVGALSDAQLTRLSDRLGRLAPNA
jgi:hypothetical protein